MKLTVFTCVFGNRGKLYPVKPQPNVEYIAYSYAPIECAGWKNEVVKPAFRNSRMHARMLKTSSCDIFTESFATIWVDARFVLHDPMKLAQECLQKSPISCIADPEVDCVYDYGQLCLDYRLDDPYLIRKQLRAYERFGVPNHMGGYLTGVLVRDNSDTVHQFEQVWQASLQRYSIRDQLSFIVACNDVGIKPHTIQKGPKTGPHWIDHRYPNGQTHHNRWLEIGPGENPVLAFTTIAGGAQSIDVNRSYAGKACKLGTETIPYPDNHFDYIYASHVLEHVHWSRCEQAFRDIYRVTAPGGRVEIWVPDTQKIVAAWLNEDVLDKSPRYMHEHPDHWFARRMYAHEGDTHQNCFDAHSLQRHLFAAGFVGVELLDMPTWPTTHATINLGATGVKTA